MQTGYTKKSGKSGPGRDVQGAVGKTGQEQGQRDSRGGVKYPPCNQHKMKMNSWNLLLDSWWILELHASGT